MYIEDDDDLIAALSQAPQDAPPLQKICEGIADYDTSFELINRYSAGNPHRALGFCAGQWFETTEEIYWYFLECLPPLHMTGAGFVMSECTMGDLYESFWEIDGRYFNAVIAWNGPTSFKALRNALVAEVRA